MSLVYLNIALAHLPNLTRRIGLKPVETPTRAEYLEYITSRFSEIAQRYDLTLVYFERRENTDFYDSVIRLQLPSNDHRAVHDVISEIVSGVSRGVASNDYVEAVSVETGKVKILADNLKTSPRNPSVADLSKLGDATEKANLILAWLNDVINSRQLQVDTLTAVLQAQLSHMTSVLDEARSKPFTGMAGNKTHREQTAVRFMNLGARNLKLAEVIRRHVLEGQNDPQTIIDEFSLVLADLKEVLNTNEFDYKPAPLHPLSEIYRLAASYGPAIEHGGAQITPAYLQRVLEQFPKDSLNGDMLRFGMFLATHMANEIREGLGGTENMTTLHERLANEFGTIIVRPTNTHDDDNALTRKI